MNDLKAKLLESIEGLSKNLRDNYDNFYNILKDSLIDCGPPSNLLLKNFISNKLGRNNNIEKSIDDIINDIINKSRTCTDWKNSETLCKKNRSFFFH